MAGRLSPVQWGWCFVILGIVAMGSEAFADTGFVGVPMGFNQMQEGDCRDCHDQDSGITIHGVQS